MVEIVDDVEKISFSKGESSYKHRDSVVRAIRRDYPFEETRNAMFTFDVGGKSQGFYFRPCHADVKRTDASTTYFINYFNEENPTGREEMLSFLLSDESPYKDALKKATVLRLDGAIQAVIFRDFANEDIKLLTNLLIATRLNTQWGYGPLYLWLMQSGIRPETALILCQSVYNSKLSQSEENYNLREHLNLESDTGADGPFNSKHKNSDEKYFSPKRFYEKDHTVCLTRKDTDPNPCNFIWGGLDYPIIRRKSRKSDYTGDWNMYYQYPCVGEKSEFAAIYAPFQKGSEKPDEGLLKEVERKFMEGIQVNAA